MSGSYRLKHKIESFQHEYLSNGDCIVAMLVKGLTARFAKKGFPLRVNCEFKAMFIQ